MNKFGLKYALLLITIVVLSGCNVTRYIPEGHYMLQTVSIESDKETPSKERISADDIEKYLTLTPNRRLFGTNFYVWFYQKANPDKQNKWNNFKRKIGQPVALLNQEEINKTLSNFKIYMNSTGYLASNATYQVDTLKNQRVNVNFKIKQNQPYIIDSLNYRFDDASLEAPILADTAKSLLRRGEIFDITILDAERARIAERLRDRGYYTFSVGNIEYLADTLGVSHHVGVTMVIKQHLAGYNTMGEPIRENSETYKIGDITIRPNYNPNTNSDTTKLSAIDTMQYGSLNIVYKDKPNIRPKILRYSIPIHTDSLYNNSAVSRAYSELMSLGYFRSARITFNQREMPSTLDSVQRKAYSPILDCSIDCTPALRQNFNIDLQGSVTSSFYGLMAKVGYQNLNIFKGAESLNIGFTTGYEFQKAPDAKKKTSKEFGVSLGLNIPRFLFPYNKSRFPDMLHQRSKIDISVNFQNRPYYERTLSSASLGYTWSNKQWASFSYKPIDINIINVTSLDESFLEDIDNKYLLNSYQTQFVGGTSFSYNYNNQGKNISGNSSLIRINAEAAGNLIDGVSRLIGTRVKDGEHGDQYRDIFGMRYAQYFRFDVSASRKLTTGYKTAFVGRLYAGAGLPYGNSIAIPFDRQFYAGGSNSMRGWTPRTLGPGSVEVARSEYPAQTGDMKLEANVEFRFPIWGLIHGATFLDLGNIWMIRSKYEAYPEDSIFKFDNFYKQLGFNTGLGIRFDITYAIIRLDWGVQLHNPNRPIGERWISNFKWQNTSLNFGVGYPF